MGISSTGEVWGEEPNAGSMKLECERRRKRRKRPNRPVKGAYKSQPAGQKIQRGVQREEYRPVLHVHQDSLKRKEADKARAEAINRLASARWKQESALIGISTWVLRIGGTKERTLLCRRIIMVEAGGGATRVCRTPEEVGVRRILLWNFKGEGACKRTNKRRTYASGNWWSWPTKTPRVRG